MCMSEYLQMCSYIAYGQTADIGTEMPMARIYNILLTERNHDEDKTIESSNAHEHKPLQGDNVAFHLKKLIHFAFRNGMLVLRK